jgi:hypothetical protein
MCRTSPTRSAVDHQTHPPTKANQLALDFGPPAESPASHESIREFEVSPRCDSTLEPAPTALPEEGAAAPGTNNATCLPEAPPTESAGEPEVPSVAPTGASRRPRSPKKPRLIKRKVALAPVRVGTDARLARFVYPQTAEPIDLELDSSIYEAASAGLACALEGKRPTHCEPLTASLYGLLKNQPLVVILAHLGSAQLSDALATCAIAFFRELHEHESPADPTHKEAYYHLSLALRSLSGGEINWIGEILKLAQPPDAASIARELRRYRTGHGKVEQHKALEKIERAFAFVVGERQPRPRTGDDEEPQKKGPRTSGTDDEPRLDDDLVGATPETVYDVGPARAKNRTNPIPVAVQRGINQVVMVAENHYLGSHDLLLLRDELLSEDSPHAATLAASLWGGLWWPQARSWMAFSDAARALATPGWTICVIPEPLAFLIANGAQSSLPKSAERSAATHLYLPVDPGRLGAEALKEKVTARAGQPLFVDNEIRGLNGRIADIRVAQGASVTTAAVGAQMKRHLLQTSGDQGLSAILRGDAIPSHLIARLSYRRWTLASLGTAFANACDFLESRLRSGTTYWSIREAEHPASKAPPGIDLTAVVGSLRCPDLADAREMTRSLRDGIARPPCGYPHLSQIVKVHQRLLAHTVTLLFWASGARPCDRTLDAFQDTISDLVLLADKATTAADPRLRKRAVRLCRMAMTQLRLWESHRAFVIDKVLGGKRSVPMFFHLDSEGQPVRLTHPLYKRITPHRLCRSNAGRHALATGLLERGVSMTRVNSLLGHALPGEEPGAPFHAGRPTFSDDELLLIDAHLATSGFRTLSGYSSRGSK